MKFQSRLIGRAIKIVLAPDPAAPVAVPEETLVLEYSIDCDLCGQHTVRLAGHHLRALRNLLVETIDLHPGLCGEDSGIEVASRLSFSGKTGGDPSVN